VVNTTGCPAELLSEWAAARIVTGDGAVAQVRLFNEETYLVLSLARAANVDLTVRTITTGIAGLPGAPRVAWVRPLNRRHQALFGWGDVAAGPGEAPATEELALPAQLPGRPACVWRQHPMAPQPFFVLDYKRWPDEEKVAWLRQELGGGADVQDFARKWQELFGDTTGAASQKTTCLKLFCAYSGLPWRKESDLPPAELTEFLRVWDPAAPERCSECSRAAPPPGRFTVRKGGRPYCSEACACAGQLLTCRRCGGAVDTEYPRCTSCNWGLVPPRALGDALEESELALCKFLRITRCTVRQDDSREAAWKKRRRA
jgi:hypothetical protein